MTYDWLTGRGRVATAVNGTPDCVPIYATLTEHARYLFGIPTQKFYTTPGLFAEAQMLVSEYYGLDLAGVHGDVLNIEAEALGKKVVYRKHGAPLLEPGPSLYQTVAEVDRISEIDPTTAGRMPFMLEVYRLVGEMTSLPAERWFTAPFSLLCAVQGYERVVQDAANNPAFLQRLQEALVEYVLIPWIRTSLKQYLPAWAATGDDPWASFPVITTDIYHRFVLPPVAMLQRAFQAEGYRIAVMGAWGDARASDPKFLLEERVRLQGALRGLDPDVQRLGPEFYAEIANQHGVALGLGIDSRLIHDGPIDAIVQRVKDYISRAGRNGRLTLLIHNVPEDTPSEHIHAAVAAARLYGHYPIADELDSLPFIMPKVEPFVDFARRRGFFSLFMTGSGESHV